jgi:hypothetical protein
MKNHHISSGDWLRVQIELNDDGIVMFSASDAEFGLKRFVFHPFMQTYTVVVRRGPKAETELVYAGSDHMEAINAYNELELV